MIIITITIIVYQWWYGSHAALNDLAEVMSDGWTTTPLYSYEYYQQITKIYSEKGSSVTKWIALKNWNN